MASRYVGVHGQQPEGFCAVAVVELYEDHMALYDG